MVYKFKEYNNNIMQIDKLYLDIGPIIVAKI